jgi:hypothetical protein
MRVDNARRMMWRWLSVNLATIVIWAGLIVAAAIAFWISKGTSYHQLTVGILLSSIALPVALLVVDLIFIVLTPRTDTRRGPR